MTFSPDKKYYTGIGSRATPEDIQQLMGKIATRLQTKGYILRSGGAEGADKAFENNCRDKEIYIPYDGFNGRKENGLDYIIPKYEPSWIEKYHPRPSSLSKTSKLLMNRNTYQVLGLDLKTPSDFIVCWTPDGLPSGGTVKL